MKQVIRVMVLVFFPLLSYSQLTSSTLDSAYEKGVMHLKQGSLVDANECFSMVINSTPYDANARFYRGNVNYQLGNRDSACLDWNFAAAACDQEALDQVYKKCDSTFIIVKEMPEFPGNGKDLFTFIKESISYPVEAKKHNISGRVYTSFIISNSGEIKNIKILKGLGYGLDEEAVRVIKLMPKWIPGKNCGIPVNARFNLPISFSY